MENKPIARTLRLLSQLMELHGVNPFKIKSIANAALKVDKLPFPIAGKPLAELEKIDGIGKSIAAKIVELLENGTMIELREMLDQTPEGIVEMMGIKGLGPKKVAIIWKELGIENIGELYYACNENRLIEAKGFGLKTQEEIKRLIEFRMAGNGKFLYSQVEQEVKDLMEEIKGIFPDALKHVAGEFRRLNEIISELVIVIGSLNQDVAFKALAELDTLQNVVLNGTHINAELKNGLLVDMICVDKADYYYELFVNTGTTEHVEEVLSRINIPLEQPETEEIIYQKAGLAWMQPELREDKNFIQKAAENKLPTLISYYDLKGSLHNHSTWSDGVNTLEEIALYCRDELKLEYLGISDHSKSAFYAKGLSIERVLQQQEEIDHLNKKITGFHIFKGIESDILNDGSLDYPDEILKKFDFIVASIHANLKMQEDKATARLIKAIENPFTTILGHPTGRLLLSRKGYEIDHKKVIDACAANNVVIEINANPVRLDLDWRWHQYALDKGVMLSINPDAHRNSGFSDMHYGTNIARKGGLTKEMCLNALPLAEITKVFEKKKSGK
ncbi:DNA polymerase/3'-5' exonuclease PolX [Mucilaginibacter phyllosphaerae]|uniref:DNA polymerase (Family 10) n=1 Tax=Mucilaginibacter phyllosphaerae TaxID=1812349 RepID=A0A4Y8A8A4_9SPHI|nr:DNA polymerase/3'-5' exonuclease PolX [Mucilaginibacter phyllosphaerae]MBB3970621.1 DNA polymerase (family 10) [Mucilaginibacter phyllosphaerae]TEW64628.1 DNA polymerase/3'-5' exonuclease PolX [Mucilaginibacter phyllosphaerae]GGH19907.1 DNA polymerase/3'-5' exonuclease PolX [Mucilaginibacter phyllosphaerae]